MDKTINDCLVKLISDYEVFCDAKYGQWMIWEKPKFSLEILAMAIFLELPESPNLLQLEDLKNHLLKNYLGYSDLSKEYVFIEAYYRTKDCKIKNKCYMWSVFHYTYEMENDNEVKKREFLCISIIFPYIYKLNKFQKIQKKHLHRLMRIYRVVQYWKDLKGEYLKDNKKFDLFDEKEMEKHFCEKIIKVRGVDTLLPRRDEMDTIIEEASYGAKLIKVVYSGGFQYDKGQYGEK